MLKHSDVRRRDGQWRRRARHKEEDAIIRVFVMNRVRVVLVQANATGSFAFVGCDILHLPPRTNGIAPCRTGPRVQRPKRSTADVQELFEPSSTVNHQLFRVYFYIRVRVNFFFFLPRNAVVPETHIPL